MNKRLARFIALAAAVAGTAGTALFAGGPASADAHTNQQWYSNVYGGSYLGNDSSASDEFHIYPAAATDKCLDVPGNRFYYVAWDVFSGLVDHQLDPSGAQVQMWDCEPADHQHDYDANQQWTERDNGDGSWTFTVFDGENHFYALDSLGGHDYDSSPVEVYPANYGSSQRWTIGPDAQLQSVDSPGKCLDDTSWGDYNGSPIQLWSCAY
jgi:hypothetical protein